MVAGKQTLMRRGSDTRVIAARKDSGLRSLPMGSRAGEFNGG
jgi:hypothetical protein